MRRMASLTAGAAGGDGKRIYLDIDINHSRECYARAAEFVDATNLRYNFSSKNIADLGGRERESIKEFYSNDFDWCSKGPIVIKPQSACRIIIELYEQSSPLACENFEAICVGNKGLAKSSNMPLSYKNVKFHRIIPGFIAQGGDFVFQNGSGGESIWGKKFKDEKGGLSRKHDKAGVVSMCNGGKHSNTSQFFFTFAPCPQLDGKHVVFGQIVSGMEVLEMMSAAARAVASTSGGGSGGGQGEMDLDDRVGPGADVVITECGVFKEGMLEQGYWAPGGAFEALPVSPGSAGVSTLVVVLASSKAALEKYQLVMKNVASDSITCEYTLEAAEVLQKLQLITSESLFVSKIVIVVAPGVDESVKLSIDRAASACNKRSAASCDVIILVAKPAEALTAVNKAISCG